MGEKRIKEKAELGVGGYFKRIFAFWGVAVFIAAACVGVAASAPDLNATATCAAVLAASVVLWLFPAFCVDVLKPRPILATLASFFCVLLACFATATFGPRWVFEVEDGKRFVVLNGWTERAVVSGVTLLYVAWLVAKLRDKKVSVAARRLSKAIFAATLVSAVAGLVAWATLGMASGTLRPTGFGLWLLFFYPGLLRPAFIALGAGAATFGVFALCVRLNRDKTEREPEVEETSEKVEIAGVESVEKRGINNLKSAF